MSIYLTYFKDENQVEHRTACGQRLKLGALVRISSTYKVDFESERVDLATGMTYRVVGLESYPSSMRENLGIERDRKANAEIDAGKERWYAAVLLRSVVRDESDNVAKLRQNPCEKFISKVHSCALPAEMLELIEQGHGNPPRPGVDYSISPYEHLYPLYQAVDQTYEGFSNRPTAFLALYLLNDKPSRLLLKRSLTKAGRLTEAKLRQLTQREGWLKHVDSDAYYTDPFPTFAPYRTDINYEEIAQALTEPARNP